MMKLPVLPQATLPGGSAVTGIADLKKHLTQNKKEQFAEAFVSKIFTYALGRRLELVDKKVIKELTSKFIASDYRIKELIHIVVASEPFLSK